MTSALDPIGLEVLSHRLREIVETMEHLLFHGGYSTVLRESYDGSAGITDADGRAVMCSGFPIHVACYAMAVRATLASYPPERMSPGDSFIANNPYVAGSMHAPDMVVVTPAFHGGRVVAFCVSIAHKTDLGGLVAGSCPADATEVFHEGVLIGPARYYADHQPDPGIESVLTANSRTPEVVVGDVRSQVGCTQVGARRLSEQYVEHGAAAIQDAFDRLIDGSEQRVRRALASVPDWTGSVDIPFQVTGVELAGPLRLRMAIEKRGDGLSVDLSETSPQVQAPVNILPQAVQAAVIVSLVSFLDPTIPINEGVKNVVAIRNPSGLLTCPEHPAPVNHYFPVMYLLYCSMLKALGELDSSGFATAGFEMGTVSFGFGPGIDGRRKVLYELLPPSLGGSSEGDGAFGVAIMIHFTPSASIEVIETEYPVTFGCFSVRADSAGAGTHRGGPGYRRDYVVEEPCEVTVRLSPLDLQGWGCLGGDEPPPGNAWITRRGEDGMSPVPLFSRHVLAAGDTVSIAVSGGGGWGLPDDRAPHMLANDVLDGYVSPAGAAMFYGH